jgi:hypothetical protein
MGLVGESELLIPLVHFSTIGVGGVGINRGSYPLYLSWPSRHLLSLVYEGLVF